MLAVRLPHEQDDDQCKSKKVRFLVQLQYGNSIFSQIMFRSLFSKPACAAMIFSVIAIMY
ncbi:MAG: hypothetical protein CMO13_02320, partial [Thaumarchaeota archaeon]|nr:hypothetical protein [Nitrososphaerota archaeon]